MTLNPSPQPMEKVGLIAGSGIFPLLFADEVRRLGFSVIAVAHVGETFPALEEKVDRISWIHVGQLNRLIAFLKREGIERAVMAGAIKKTRLFTNVRPDLRSIGILRRVRDHRDDFILRAVADELESEGITIEGATRYVPSFLASPGVMSYRTPTQQEWEDLKFGLKVGRELGSAGVGQCVVVKKKSVLAVEAIEGTDETIKRGGRFAEKAVVVKVCKPQQDLRFDLPTVGPGTIRSMNEVGACCLGVEVGRTVVLERATMIADANESSVALVGLE
jgi:DUF1009 family protein